MEYGKDVQDSGFIAIAGLIAHAWHPDESLRFQALDKLFAKHQDNVKNLRQQGGLDRSAEMELWYPCVTFPFPPNEKATIDRIKAQDNERSRRVLQVYDANVRAWRIWYGFGEGPWKVSRKATPEDLATQSRWVQLNWPIHRSHGVFCPSNCLCSKCLNNHCLNDKTAKLLRHLRNPKASNEDVDATMSAMVDFRHYCLDISYSLRRRANMNNDIRDEIAKRVSAELDWLFTDDVKAFATKQEFQQHKEQLASSIDPMIHTSSREFKLDTLDTERRAKMREYFLYQDIVKATDPSNGESVVGRIVFTVKSKWLGIGDDPDWVYIKDTWYRDNEVELATTQEIVDYQISVIDSESDGDNSLDGNIIITRFDGSISHGADAVSQRDQPLPSEHTAGCTLHCRICKHDQYASDHRSSSIQLISPNAISHLSCRGAVSWFLRFV